MGKTAASPFQVKIHNDHNLDVVRRSHLDTEVHSGARILASFYVPVSVPGCLGDPFEPEVHNNWWTVGHHLKNKPVLSQ